MKKGYTLYFITSSAVLHLLGGSGISVMHVGHLTRITFVGLGFGILSKQSLQMRCPSLHWYILHTGKSRHTGHRYIFSNVARSRRPASPGVLLVFPIFQILLMFLYKICYTLSWPRRKRKLERLGLQQADRDYTVYHLFGGRCFMCFFTVGKTVYSCQKSGGQVRIKTWKTWKRAKLAWEMVN